MAGQISSAAAVIQQTLDDTLAACNSAKAGDFESARVTFAKIQDTLQYVSKSVGDCVETTSRLSEKWTTEVLKDVEKASELKAALDKSSADVLKADAELAKNLGLQDVYKQIEAAAKKEKAAAKDRRMKMEDDQNSFGSRFLESLVDFTSGMNADEVMGLTRQLKDADQAIRESGRKSTEAERNVRNCRVNMERAKNVRSRLRIDVFDSELKLYQNHLVIGNAKRLQTYFQRANYIWGRILDLSKSSAKETADVDEMISAIQSSGDVDMLKNSEDSDVVLGSFRDSFPKLAGTFLESKSDLSMKSFMSKLDSLQTPSGVRYGSRVRVVHNVTKCALSSTASLLYFHSGSSNQQVVGASAGRGVNDSWLILKTDYTQGDGAELKSGNEFVLQHVASGAMLHSHSLPAPITEKAHEVTCYSGRDANDVFVVSCKNSSKTGGILPMEAVTITHKQTNGVLQSENEDFALDQLKTNYLTEIFTAVAQRASNHNTEWLFSI